MPGSVVVGPGWGMPRMVAQQVSGEKMVAAAQLPGTWVTAPV